MENENMIQSAERLTRASQVFSSLSAESFVIVPDGYELKSLLEFEDQPRRIKDRLTFGRLDSFCQYVNDFKLPGTRIFVNPLAGCAKAVIDFHTRRKDAAARDIPGWCDHTAEFTPLLSEEWKRWSAANARQFDQKTFALFLEDNAADIVSPPAAEVLDVSRTLSAKLTVNFKKGVRLDNTTEQLTYEETVDAKAGHKGDLSIPTEFMLEIPVFEGRPARPVEARLRYAIRDGTLIFHYVLIRPHKVFQAEVDSIGETIGKALDLKPLFGVDV